MPDELPAELQGSMNSLYLDMSPEIKDLMHGWLYKIVEAAYEGIGELPPEHRDKVLQKISKACSDQAKLVLDCQPGMKWEDYKNHMANLKPPFGPREVTQVGDIVHWTYVPPKDSEGKPICQCPLIMFGWMKPRPEVCACSANSVASYIEDFAADVEVETVETLGSPMVNGEDKCRFLIHLKPSKFASPKHDVGK